MRGWLLACAVLVGCGGGGASPWVEQEVPGGAVGESYVVWAFAEDDVWLGGSSVWNFDGQTWNEVPLPVDGFVVDFWGFAPDDLWAIGNSNVFHWDGSGWTESPAAEGLPFEVLSVIWGTSSTDLWIANSDNSKVYHYDGASWTRQTLQFVFAHALFGTASDDIWLTGPTDTYRYDGTAWTVYEPEGFGPDPRGSYAIWGSAPNDVWASEFSAFLHWDGSVWTEIEADDEYNSMWGFAPDDIYAVGSRGTMAHYNGSSWSESSGHLTAQQNFTHVHGSSPDNLWATAIDFNTLTGMVLRLE